MVLAEMVFSLAVLAGGPIAHAASFDCAKSATPREQLICANPDLSKLDGEVGQLYQRALTQLSPNGATQLKQRERQWLAFLSEACPLPEKAVGVESKNCIAALYRDRVDDLKLAAVRNGPYLFTRVDLYRAEPAPPERAELDDHRPSVSHIAYPQIDQPISAITRQWNSIAKQVDDESICGPPQDVEVSYALGLATTRLISVSRGTWSYCYGMAHGNGSGEVQNTVISPGLRSLRPDDLFRKGAPWKAKLTRLVRAAVEKQARGFDPDLSHLAIDVVNAAAASPNRWFLKPDGVQIDFNSYELGEGYPFVPTVEVPWSALRDVLAVPPI